MASARAFRHPGLRVKPRACWIGTAALALFPGCRSDPPVDLAAVYQRAAEDHQAQRNPVVLIPGLLGSRLEEDGRVVWGAFSNVYADPSEPDGARAVALPMRAGARLAELADGVVPTGALSTLTLSVFGVPYGVTAYRGLLVALGVGGYRDEELGLAGAIDYGEGHYTCFQFAYDWRRSIDENAVLLHEFLAERREYVRAETKSRFGRDDEVKFDLVAHSMGGLVARYYLRYGGKPLPEDGPVPEPDWSGAELVERAILVGPPNAGAIEAFLALAEGWKPGPFLPRYPPAVLATMPALYQLLPRGRHGAIRVGGERVEDLFDPELWERNRWAFYADGQDEVLATLLPNVQDAERTAVAREHLERSLAKARRVQRALDAPSTPPPGVELMLAAGDSVDTASAVEIDPDTGRAAVVERAAGDGTVTRASALLDERVGGAWTSRLVSPVRWSRVMFFFRDHVDLTRDPAFLDNLLYVLLEEPRP